MPAAAPIIAAVAAPTITGALTRIALSLAVSFITNKLFAPDVPDGGDGLAQAADQGVLQRIATNTSNKLPVAYGENRVFGSITFADISSDNQHMYFIIPLCEGPIEEIGNIYWDNYRLSFKQDPNDSTLMVVTNAQVIKTDGTPDTTQDNDFLTNNLRIRKFPEGGACPNMVNRSNKWKFTSDTEGNITSTEAIRNMTNIAYLYVELDYNREKGITGLSSKLGADIRGKKIRTITNGTTINATQSYSNNPAECLLDYLTNPVYGCGSVIKDKDIDTNTFYNHKVFCDDTITFVDTDQITVSGNITTWNTTTQYNRGDSVSTGSPLKYYVSLTTNTNSIPASGNTNWKEFTPRTRYSTNGIANTNDSRDIIISDLTTNSQAVFAYQLGKYQVLSDRALTTAEENALDPENTNFDSDLRFNKDNTYGSVTIINDGINSLKNTMSASFVSKDHNNKDHQVFVDIFDRNIKGTNEGELVQDTRFKFINDSIQAKRALTTLLNKSRDTLIVSFDTDSKAFKLQVNDVITYTNEVYNFTNKKFRINSISETQLEDNLSGYKLTCQEYNGNAYGIDVLTADLLAPNTNIPNANNIGSVTDLVVLDNTVFSPNVNFGTVPLKWTVPSGLIDNFEIYYSDSLIGVRTKISDESLTGAGETDAARIDGQPFTAGAEITRIIENVPTSDSLYFWIRGTNSLGFVGTLGRTTDALEFTRAIPGPGPTGAFIVYTYAKDSNELNIKFTDSTTSGDASTVIMPANLNALGARSLTFNTASSVGFTSNNESLTVTTINTNSLADKVTSWISTFNTNATDYKARANPSDPASILIIRQFDQTVRGVTTKVPLALFQNEVAIGTASNNFNLELSDRPELPLVPSTGSAEIVENEFILNPAVSNAPTKNTNNTNIFWRTTLDYFNITDDNIYRSQATVLNGDEIQTWSDPTLFLLQGDAGPPGPATLTRYARFGTDSEAVALENRINTQNGLVPNKWFTNPDLVVGGYTHTSSQFANIESGGLFSTNLINNIDGTSGSTTSAYETQYYTIVGSSTNRVTGPEATVGSINFDTGFTRNDSDRIFATSYPTNGSSSTYRIAARIADVTPRTNVSQVSFVAGGQVSHNSSTAFNNIWGTDWSSYSAFITGFNDNNGNSETVGSVTFTNEGADLDHGIIYFTARDSSSGSFDADRWLSGNGTGPISNFGLGSGFTNNIDVRFDMYSAHTSSSRHKFNGVRFLRDSLGLEGSSSFRNNWLLFAPADFTKSSDDLTTNSAAINGGIISKGHDYTTLNMKTLIGNLLAGANANTSYSLTVDDPNIFLQYSIPHGPNPMEVYTFETKVESEVANAGTAAQTAYSPGSSTGVRSSFTLTFPDGTVVNEGLINFASDTPIADVFDAIVAAININPNWTAELFFTSIIRITSNVYGDIPGTFMLTHDVDSTTPFGNDITFSQTPDSTLGLLTPPVANVDGTDPPVGSTLTVTKTGSENDSTGSRSFTLAPSLTGTDLRDALILGLEDSGYYGRNVDNTSLIIEDIGDGPSKIVIAIDNTSSGGTLSFENNIIGIGQRQVTNATANRWSRPLNTGIQVT